MIAILRAAAVAVVTLGCAGALAYADPSVAGENTDAVAAPVYTDHATAQLVDPNAGTAEVGAPAPASSPSSERKGVIGALKGMFVPQPAVTAPAPALPVQPQPLEQLVAGYTGFETLDPEHDCLARAIYYEARGEPLEGQLAVANVVLNRAASGRYPASLCEVVRQPAQFSFVRRGRIPAAPHDASWARAVGIASVAAQRFASGLTPNVLWYHADYVAPSWGRRLTRVAKIGAHIFYS